MPVLTGLQMMRKTDWLTGIKAAFELLRTFMNFIFSWTFLNFFELYSKCFELHNYGQIFTVERWVSACLMHSFKVNPKTVDCII